LESSASEQSEISLNSSRGSSLPQSNSRRSTSFGPEFNLSSVIGISQLVGVGGSSVVSGDLVDKGNTGVGKVIEGSGLSGSRVDGGVVTIGHSNKMLLSNELVEEELGFIRDKELVLGSNDDQLGHIDESIVVDGVFNGSDELESGISDSSSNSLRNVIAEGKSPVSVASEDAVQVGKSVLDGHNDGDDSGDSSVNSSGQPSGPSSL